MSTRFTKISFSWARLRDKVSEWNWEPYKTFFSSQKISYEAPFYCHVLLQSTIKEVTYKMTLYSETVITIIINSLDGFLVDVIRIA